jgi:hypothetical protein
MVLVIKIKQIAGEPNDESDAVAAIKDELAH